MNKLKRLLDSLTETESTQFRQALASSWFNQQSDVIRLFDWICATREEYLADQQPSVEDISKALFPEEGKPFTKTRHLISALCGKLEDFWVLRQARRNRLHYNALLNDALAKRGLNKDRVQALSMARRKWPSYEARLKAELLLAETSYEAAERVRAPENSKHLYQAYRISERLARHKRIKYACEELNRSAILSIDHEASLAINEMVLPNDDPVDQAYLLVYFILREADYIPARHQALASLLKEESQGIEPEDLQALYEFSINIAIRVINRGAGDYLRPLFNTYLQALELGLLVTHKGLSIQHFKNIITTGLRLGELSWVSDFIATEGESLNVDDRAGILDFYYALLSFEEGNFARTVRLLFQHYYSDPFYQLSAKTLLAKAYYEQEDLEPLFSLLESLRAYLRRNRKLSALQRSNYLNFIKALKKLAQAKAEGGIADPKKSSFQLEGFEQLAERPWLEKMREELAV